MLSYARTHGFAYVSPFWSSRFFAYLPWTPALDGDSYAVVSAAANRLAGTAIAANRFSSTGRAYRGLAV